MWQQWINAVLGLWTIATAYLGFTGTTQMWVLTITGLLVTVLALWGAGQESSERQHMAELERRLQHQRAS